MSAVPQQGDLFAVCTPAPLRPIDEATRQRVRQQTEHYCRLAERLFKCTLPPLPVSFDLKGTCSGMFVAHGDKVRVRYNPWIFARYLDDSLNNTVPHEVAHFVVHQRYKRRVKPHGPQWQKVMAAFGVRPEVTSRYDLSDIPQRRQRSHTYECGCREHALSTTRHNRVQRRSAQYTCISCGDRLVYRG